MAITSRSYLRTEESTPVPRDLESRAEFMTRYSESPVVQRKIGSVLTRRIQADLAWTAAKSRSRVSVKTNGGEWLMFD